MIKIVLKKCGQFLIKLDLREIEDYDFEDDEDVSTILSQCSKLRSIHFGGCILDRNSIRSLKPNFHNVEYFLFEIDENDERNIGGDLSDLFQQNKKLKFLKMKVQRAITWRMKPQSFIYNYDCLKAISYETLNHIWLEDFSADLNVLCSMPILKWLKLKNQKVTDDILIGISKNCLNLECITMICKFAQFLTRMLLISISFSNLNNSFFRLR